MLPVLLFDFTVRRARGETGVGSPGIAQLLVGGPQHRVFPAVEMGLGGGRPSETTVFRLLDAERKFSMASLPVSQEMET